MNVLDITERRSGMTLYSSSNLESHRIRIVLAEKGLAVDVLDIDSDQRARQEINELNPYGTTPVMLDRDLVLYESNVIMEYLDERFPHPPLMSAYPIDKARQRLMRYRIDRDWYRRAEKLLQPETATAELRGMLTHSITSISPVFEQKPFFMSEDFSLLDCSLAPILWRLDLMDIRLPAQAKAVTEYTVRLFERASFVESLTKTEMSMKRSTG